VGHIERRTNRYRARYRDPLGRSQSKTFTRKSDAERFLREVELDKQRGNWIDPRDGDLPLALWADTFLSLARRLSPTTQDTYRRDLERYILPALRVVSARPDPRRRDRAMAQRRGRRRVRGELGAPALPDPAASAGSRRPETEDRPQRLRPRRPTACAEA
jgi:hypothetical protein